MKTLVIHPIDASTKFLSIIYAQHSDWTICRDPETSDAKLKQLIKDNDRIIIMGHGTSKGLLNPAPFCSITRHYLIDDSFADLLREKELIAIWCYANEFCERNNIKGFHTGMIISELAEEYYMLGHAPLDIYEMDLNMYNFAMCIASSLSEWSEYYYDGDPELIYGNLIYFYTGDDEVTQFNRKNIIVGK